MSNDYLDVIRLLTGHPDYVQYITVLPMETHETPAFILKEQMENCHMLTECIPMFEALELPKVTPISTEKKAPLRGRISIRYKYLQFAKTLLVECQRKDHERSETLKREFLKFLNAILPYKNGASIFINSKSFTSHVVNPSCTTQRLARYVAYNQSLLYSFRTTVKVNLMLELATIVDLISVEVGANTHFFEHQLQSQANAIFLSDSFQFSRQMNDLVDNFSSTEPTLVVENIFSTVVDINAAMGKSQKRNKLVIAMLIYDFIFNRVQIPIGKGEKLNFTKYTMEQISLDPKVAPEFDPKATPFEVFMSYPLLVEAIDRLNAAMFFTNPFDILACVVGAVEAIEVAISSFDQSKSSFYSFETTFGFFLGVLFSSDLIEWTDMVELVDLYTPSDGLAPTFEYARSTMVASLMHLKDLT